MSGGWSSNVHLTCHQGARPIWNDTIAAFVPGNSLPPGLIPAGAANGSFSTYGALFSGQKAADAALDDLGIPRKQANLPEAEDTPVKIAPFWHVHGAKRAWVDQQNDVTAKDIRLAHQENFVSVEHLKRYTTLGMATDQGKTSNTAGLAIMAEIAGKSIPEVGTTMFRPPYTPTAIGVLAGRARDEGFRPVRKTPSHVWAEEQGAVFVEVGMWLRAQWFPKPGETRYGLMLREDGIAMDDGTAARLAEDQFVVTTTTANAVPIYRHMEFVRQCLFPDMDVQLISTTEAWAQCAVAGPNARALLQQIVDHEFDISNGAFPFMACAEISVAGGLRARLFRISFSGELAFEIAVPTRYGDSLKLAGLKPVDPAHKMPAGAHLMTKSAVVTAANDQGYVTSACYSPDLGYHIGLAYLKSGDSRMGEIIRLVSPLTGVDHHVEVVSAHFVDPKGKRLRA